MSKTIQILFASTAAAALLAACGQQSGTESSAPGNAETSSSSEETAQSPTEQINAWFEEEFERGVARSPMSQTFLGRKTNYDKWDDVSDEFARESHRLDMAALDEMRAAFNINELDSSAQLSYRLAEYSAELSDRRFPYRNHWYVFSQFTGPHSSVPSFMINQHRVSDQSDAEAYIARLNGIKTYLGQHQTNAEEQFSRGINPPGWAYPQMIATSRNIISGAPFDDSEKNRRCSRTSTKN